MACRSARFMGMSRPVAASTSSISNDLVRSRAPSSALILIKRDLTNSPDPAQAVQGRPKPSASNRKFGRTQQHHWSLRCFLSSSLSTETAANATGRVRRGTSSTGTLEAAWARTMTALTKSIVCGSSQSLTRSRTLLWDLPCKHPFFFS
jgi:hypothetical protein